MRSKHPLWLILPALLVASNALRAQVTINPDALKQIAPPAATPVPREPASHHPAHRTAAAKPAAPPPAKVKAPTVALIPPEIANLPPPVAVATRAPEKIILPPAVAGAIGDTSAIKNGLRLRFGAGSSDMNAAMEQSLRDFARRAAPGPVSLDAYASGNDSDPSTPRRLSLARVLAARAILIDAGIASTDIYPRAHAPSTDTAAPPDRIDIVILPASHS